jgi:hypothetical protein
VPTAAAGVEIKLAVKLSKRLTVIDRIRIFMAIDALDVAERFRLLETTVKTTASGAVEEFKKEVILEYFERNWLLFNIGRGAGKVPVYLGLNETARFFRNGVWSDIIPGSQIHTDLELKFSEMQTSDIGNDSPLNTELFGFLATAKVKNFIAASELSLADWQQLINKSVEEPIRDLKFKIFRKIETEKKTKTGVKSKKPQARGLVCTSFVKSAKEQLQLELWRILHKSIPRDITADDVGVVSDIEASAVCSDVELLFRLLDYYRVDGHKWFLNNIFIHRFMR